MTVEQPAGGQRPDPAVVVLRPMRWWDIDEVLTLERDLFGANPWTAAGFWSELAGVPQNRTYLVAVEHGVIVGYAGLFAAGSDADVQTLAVRPDRQGAGLGRRLLAALESDAAQRGAQALLLEVRVDNERAADLYDRAGFERVGRRPGYYGVGQDGVLMRKRLVREVAP